ncbi:MAG: hypothetical protein FJZ63_02335, partial [Chlamydiae bacterium]|nr:hypothetical protein [Chlamydiota bacterium]
MSGISEVVNPNNSLLKSAQAFSGVSLPSLKKCKEACRKPFAWLRENLKKLGKTHLAETGYVGMDTLGAVRKTDAVYNTIIANNPSSVATPGVLLGTGIVEVGTGASQIGRGLSALEEVKENGDLTAGTVASLRIVRGANEATSGATMAASNGLTLARTGNSQVEKALTSLGSVANITSGISN